MPHLAYEHSISAAEGLDFAETAAARRELIADYITKHQHKGTPHVIRHLFRQLGLGEIDIIEKIRGQKFTAPNTAAARQIHFDGRYRFGSTEAGEWARYSIALKRPITNAQAAKIRALLDWIAPARCVLDTLDYRGTPLYWNGEINFDNTYNFGAA